MIRKTLLFIVLTFVFISCENEDEPKTEFELAKAKWKKLQFDDYTIQENLSCFCAGLLEWTTKVSNSEKDSVYFDESKLYDSQTYKMILDQAKTIEDVFEFIDNFDTNNVAVFEVQYDEQYGFPKSIAIDYIKEAVDDEITYLYSNFTPTK